MNENNMNWWHHKTLCVSVILGKVILPLMVQFCAQTTCPSDSTVWLGGKFKLMEKVALAPVRVGPSFFRLKVTSPPEKKNDAHFNIFRLCGRDIWNILGKNGTSLTRPAVPEPRVSIFPHGIHPCVPWAVTCELTSRFWKKLLQKERLTCTSVIDSERKQEVLVKRL